MDLGIRFRLTVFFLSMAIIPMFFLGFLSINDSGERIYEEKLNELDTLASIQKERINEILERNGSTQDEEIIALVKKFTRNTETGEMIVAKRDEDGDAVFMHERRFESAATALPIVPKERTDIPITQAFLNNEDVFTETVDYREEPVLAATRYIPTADIGIVLKIDKAEALAPIKNLRNLLFVVGLIATILIGLLAFFIAKSISEPIVRLTAVIDDLSTGKLDVQIDPRLKTTQSEIGALARSFERVMVSLKLAILRTGMSKKDIALGTQSVSKTPLVQQRSMPKQKPLRTKKTTSPKQPIKKSIKQNSKSAFPSKKELQEVLGKKKK